MTRLVHDSLWKEVARLSRRSTTRTAAVAYVTRGLEVRFDKGDLLVADASDIAVQSGQTKAAILRDAFERGARLFSRPGLHAKVLVFDNVAVVGSANLSETSVKKKIEAAVITDEGSLVDAARKFVVGLTRDSEPIDEAFLRRIEALKVAVRVPESDKSQPRRRPKGRKRSAGRPAPRRRRTIPRVTLRSPGKADIRPDDPSVLDFKGKVIALTGRFEFNRRDGARFGSQDDVIDACKTLGGRASREMVGPRTDILIVGRGGHDGYAHGTYGRKTEKAANFRKLTKRPQILLEDHLEQALESARRKPR